MKTASTHYESRASYSWWIVFVASVGMLFSYGPIITFTFGVFVGPLAQDFDWSRSQIALGLSLSNVCFAVTQPIFGRLIDRFGARRVIPPSVLIFGFSLTSLSFLTGDLWQYYLVYSIMGLCAGGSTSLAYYHVVSRWFERKRGLALGLATAGAGVGGFIMPTAVQWLETEFGWRVAYAVLGGTPVAIVIPLVLGLIREHPPIARNGGANQAAGHGEMAAASEVEASIALKTGSFWLMALSVFVVSASVMGSLAHMVPLLVGRGVSVGEAAFATSMLGGTSLLSRVFTGYLVDRVSPVIIGVGLCAAGAMGLLVLQINAGPLYYFLAAFLLGAALSMDGLIPHLIIGHFGFKAFSTIYGVSVGINALGWVVGPMAMASWFDATGTYKGIIIIFMIAVALGSILMLMLTMYRPRAVTDSLGS